MELLKSFAAINAVFVSSEGKRVKADSVFYDAATSKAKFYGGTSN